MTRERLALAGALILAGVGSVVVIRAMMQSPPAPPASVEVEVSDAVRATLAPESLDTIPTPETIDRLEHLVRRRVLEEIRAVSSLGALPDARRVDLAEAFVERWRALVDPDLQRDHATMVARGDPRPFEDTTAIFEASGSIRKMTMAPMGLGSIFVRDHTDASSAPTADGFRGFEGFDRVTSGRAKHGMPVPDGPVQEGWRSVHIVMPFKKEPLFNEGFGVALVGFQFVWSDKRAQWIPSAVVQYTAPGEVHSAIPLR